MLETGEAIEDLEVRGSTPRAPDDERVWLCSYVPDMVDDDGTVAGVSIVVRDITDRKRTEDELASLTTELESRVQARTAQVRRLATELTQAEQGERQRIAQVLHDDLQQLLYAVQLKVQMLAGDTDDARRRSLVDEARTVLGPRRADGASAHRRPQPADPAERRVRAGARLGRPTGWRTRTGSTSPSRARKASGSARTCT